MREQITMKKIAPSILSADFGRLGEEIRAVEDAGADLIHVDVMDGHFVPNITIGPPVVASIKKTARVPLDVHLMITDPDRYVVSFADAGSDIITVHAEATAHLHRTIHLIKEAGKKAGVSINPATPLVAIEQIIGDIDLLLVMTVNPGFGGQKFIESMLAKIGEARDMIDHAAPHVLLEVDGGITLRNMEVVHKAGADVFVAGSSIFLSGDYRKTIQEMRTILDR
ncbi:MAG TPA: ribulose-phosphate 3-epimerase [Syntrophales bacterium]|nr:ribulose-phosphate 3-epimerase [Syntrophales bacterium]HPQ43276.1 ribulose-phosphate 3-epimerase [Syntrophales bacterium]